MNDRRRFITLAPFAGATLLAACSKETATTAATPAPAPVPAPVAAPAAVSGATLPLLQESDPLAVGLGYVALASRADGTKYKNYTPGLACGNCSLYAGKSGDVQGPCPLFAGKQVMAAGWCSAYVKKAG